MDTHRLQYDDLVVKVNETEFHYMAPYIEDNINGKEKVSEQKCWKTRSSWDDVEVEHKPKVMKDRDDAFVAL